MEKKHALILGGTKGLGLEIAKQAEHRSVIPIIMGRSVSDSRNFPETAVAFPLDISNLEEIPSQLTVMLDDYPHLDYIFWVAGIFERKSFWDMPFNKIKRMAAIHLLGPWKALQSILRTQKAPFTWQLAGELFRDFPGSKVTLVNPGGMDTHNFWGASGQDTSKYMSPKVVAEIIWSQVQNQAERFKEIQILRDYEGTPRIEFDPRLPRLPELPA